MGGDNGQTTSAATGIPRAVNFGDLSENRKNNFDFVRFFLATLVIYHHSFDLLLGHLNAQGAFENNHPDTLAQITVHQIDTGSLAVDYFFVISGFLITASWLHSRGVADYFKKRFLRIYPGLVVACLFCIFVIGPISRRSVSNYFHDKSTFLFLRPLLLRSASDSLPGVFNNVPFPHSVNGSLWTIRYEIFCYIIVAALGMARLLRFRVAIALLFILSLGTYFARAHGLHIPGVESAELMPRLLTYFLAGMVFYLYREKIQYSPKLFAVAAIAVVVGFIANISIVAFPIFGTYLLFYIAFSSSLKMQNFARYGDFSYGTYLYAFPLQQLLIQYCGGFLNPYSLFFLAWLLTVPLAAGSWFLIEKPFLKLKSKKNIRSQNAATAGAILPSARLVGDPKITHLNPEEQRPTSTP